jgi:hypothetical protein
MSPVSGSIPGYFCIHNARTSRQGWVFKEPINDIWTEIASTGSRAISKIQGEVPTLTGLTNVLNSKAPSSL